MPLMLARDSIARTITDGVNVYRESYLQTIEEIISPVANAGPDQIVAVDEIVTLDGSGSFDPDGVIVFYEWEQLSGTVVGLDDPNAVMPQFQAPDLPSVLEFQLTVLDDDGGSDSDTVQINVIFVPDILKVEIQSRITAEEVVKSPVAPVEIESRVKIEVED